MMKILKNSIFALLLLLAVRPTVQAQGVKIGYTTVELLLNYMPETKQVNQQLETFENKLSEKLQIKQRYAQSEYQTYMEKEQSNGWSGPEEKAGMEKKITDLQKEIQKELADAESQMMRKRNELLGPIQEKIQAAIDQVAEEGGYTYILNNAIGNGVPTMLYGAEANDVTEAIAKKLGFTLPKEEE